jgi:phage terminase small subunit
MAKKLNIKHKAFADEYLSNGMIGYKAYMSVYKSVKKEETAKASASRLLTNVNINDYIDAQQAKTSKKLELKREDIVLSLSRLDQVHNELLALALKSSLTKPEQDKFARLLMVIKASDANKAREILLRMNGWEEPNSDEGPSTDYDINIVIKSKDNTKDED